MFSGYLMILVSSILFCIMSALRKEYQEKVEPNLKTTVFFMGLSSLFVCAIGFFYEIFAGFSIIKGIDSFTLILSASFALDLVINTILCIFGSKYGSLAILTVFARLGTLVVSAVYGLIYDPVRNKINLFKIIGFILVIVVIILSLIDYKRKKTKEIAVEQKNTKIFVLLCLIIFFTNGIALPIYSLFTSIRPKYGEFNFIFLYLFFSAIICFLVLFVINIKSKNYKEIKKCVNIKPLLCILGYGLTFFASELFGLICTSILPIVVQAPLTFAINVVCVAVADYLIFKEKLNKFQYLQIFLAIVVGVCFAL